MKRIRARLRRIRAKTARVIGAIEIAHRRTHSLYAQARHARAGAERLRKYGKPSRAKRAEARANNRRHKAHAWMKRTNWLAGKKKYLSTLELQAEGAKRKWLEAHPPPTTGWSEWSGKDIPAWMVPWLKKSQAAGWDGYVVSGVRTQAYSIQLCYGICGRSSCSGLCAGAGSNHNCTSGCPYPTGAIDITDYYNFQSIQYQIGSPLRNHLPSDRVHFSVSGY